VGFGRPVRPRVDDDEKIFISATKKLFEWSKGQNCRFYAIVRDATGNNKARYKHLQEMVQGNFYPFYPSPQRRARERLATPTSTPDEVSSPPSSVLQPVH
jgi:hypothetical protein